MSRHRNLAEALEIAPPDPKLRVSVIVPARNEAELLPSTLAALVHQHGLRGEPIDPRTFEVIVLANNCTDSTADLVRRFARTRDATVSIHLIEKTFMADLAHVGSARRWLMDLACERLEAVDASGGLIASTDADTRVAPTWVAAQLAEVATGAEAVAGLIQVDPRDLRRLGPLVRRAYWLDLVYRSLKLELEARIDPNPLETYPRHDFHGGASLAITPETYRRVGGLPPLPCLEDVALAEALWREDARFVHSNRVRVRTSARPLGRASGGQSHTLNQWAEDQVIEVDDAPRIEAELVARSRLRRVFTLKIQTRSPTWQPPDAEVSELAEAYQLDDARLIHLMTTLPTFGRWIEAVSHGQKSSPMFGKPALMPIKEAIGKLRARLRVAP